MNKIFFILTFLIPLSLFANFTDENLCQQLMDFKSKQKKQFKKVKALKKELIWSQLFPRKFFELDIKIEKSIKEIKTNSSIKEKGVILSIGQESVEKGAERKFKRLLNEYKKQNRKFLKLLRQKSEQKCNDKKRKLKFSYTDLESTKLKLQSYKDFTRLQEYQSVKKATKGILKNRKVDWTIKYSILKQDISSVLLSGEYQHIVIISHAKDNGFLVDSNSVILPKSLFKNSHPNIKSLLLMSCYSNKVLRKYDLVNNFLKIKGNSQKRFLLTPKSKLSIQDNKSILKILKFYLKQYTKRVLKTNNPALKEQTKIKKCTFELKSKLKGGIDLFVEDKIYLGEFIDTKTKFETNCENLNKAQYISVRPHPHQPPKFEQIYISGLKLKRHFFFKDKYSGSSFELITP